MGIESEGRKGVFLRNDQYHNKFNGGGHKCCDPSVSFNGVDWQSLPDRGDVLVFTPEEIADINERHAQALVAARGEGAVAMKSAAMKQSCNRVNDDGCGRCINRGCCIALEIGELGTPDTTTYTDTVRKEERAKAYARGVDDMEWYARDILKANRIPKSRAEISRIADRFFARAKSLKSLEQDKE